MNFSFFCCQILLLAFYPKYFSIAKKKSCFLREISRKIPVKTWSWVDEEIKKNRGKKILLVKQPRKMFRLFHHIFLESDVEMKWIEMKILNLCQRIPKLWDNWNQMIWPGFHTENHGTHEFLNDEYSGWNFVKCRKMKKNWIIIQVHYTEH